MWYQEIVKIIMGIAYKWQAFVGAIIGASAPFILWWFAETYRQRRARKEYLYYLEKLLVDQINMINDVKRTIEFFISKRLVELIDNIKANASEAYSLDQAFFPLFSVRALSNEIHSNTTGSVYIDNKVMESYKFSKDIPFMVDDLRQQFTQLLQTNREIGIRKLNPPSIQRQSYIENIEEFRKAVRRDMLEKNIPIYLKKLVETRVALNELSRIGLRTWRLRFDPKYRFYWRKRDFEEARNRSFDNIENFFKARVKYELGKINSM
jgi:hypothetical protein